MNNWVTRGKLTWGSNGLCWVGGCVCVRAHTDQLDRLLATVLVPQGLQLTRWVSNNVGNLILSNVLQWIYKTFLLNPLTSLINKHILTYKCIPYFNSLPGSETITSDDIYMHIGMNWKQSYIYAVIDWTSSYFKNTKFSCFPHLAWRIYELYWNKPPEGPEIFFGFTFGNL